MPLRPAQKRCSAVSNSHTSDELGRANYAQIPHTLPRIRRQPNETAWIVAKRPPSIFNWCALNALGCSHSKMDS